MTVLYGKTRTDQVSFSALRMVAVSMEASTAEAPDSILEPFLHQLKEAVSERSSKADETLAELVGPSMKWDAAG